MSKTERTVGRPRSLTMLRIIETAIELGLKELNMKALAAALEVNVVTLYRHVGSRDELMRVAVMHLMLQRQLGQGAGEHWAEIAIHYAGNLFELFRAEPGLLVELLNGNLQPHSEIDVLEQFLQAMASHGFSFEDGLRLHREIGLIVLGSAMGITGMQAAEERGDSWQDDFVQTLKKRDASELQAVRQVLDSFIAYDPHLWLKTLKTLLAGIALERGETLPDLEALSPIAGGDETS